MHRLLHRYSPVIPLMGLLVTTGAAGFGPRGLTFEERLEAERAMEKLYYSYQIGADAAFEAAVPYDVSEAKVRLYLRHSAARSSYWHSPVTAGSLSQELERIERGTRFPERLAEVLAALHDDPLLIQECLARPILVDRLAHAFFASDERIH